MIYFRPISLIFCLLIFTGRVYCAEYFETNSINVVNNSPISNLFGFVKPDVNMFRGVGTLTVSTQLELSNYISSTSKDGDRFFIDGETWSIRNTLSYQLNDKLILSASMPWFKHSGGITDDLIYDFHELFQMPQNGRTQDNQNTIRWFLARNNETLLSINDDMSAWGDLSLSLQVTSSEWPSVRWAFMTKLPTGDFSEQTGSEEFDAGLAVSQMNPQWFKNRSFLADIKLAFWYGAGVSYLGEVKALKALDQKPYVFTFRTGFAYEPFNNWQLKTQLDAQSPIYNTKIRELGWYPVLISISTKHSLTERTNLEFAIIEDIRPRSGPDVIFQTRFDTFF